MEAGFELSAKDEIGISANPAASGALGDGCHLPNKSQHRPRLEATAIDPLNTS